jgi:hypothetical protein
MVKIRQRKRHCLSCKTLFLPSPRLKHRQRYCSNQSCQKQRRNKNVHDWYHKHPDSLEYQRRQTQEWFKKHPSYSRLRRTQNQALEEKNRQDTAYRMQKKRRQEMFDKINSILSQLVEGNTDKCFLTKGRRWLMVGLTKQTRLRKRMSLWENPPPLRRIPISSGISGYEIHQGTSQRRGP